jgi:hypothetical protein
VQRKITPPNSNNKDGPAISRLIISPNQVGCVLGKGGSIIAEMRKLSKAHIIVLSKDKIPRGVQESDEVVQVCFCIVNPICQYDKKCIWTVFILMNVYFIYYFAFGFTQARLFLHNTCISFLGLIINCRISTLSDHWGF